MIYHIYVLKSTIKDWIYVGMTNNLKKRISQHQKGQSKSTAPYVPFELVFTEEYENTNNARKREKYLKTASGKRYIRAKYIN